MVKCECGHAACFHTDAGCKKESGFAKLNRIGERMMGDGGDYEVHLKHPVCMKKDCGCLRYTPEE